MKCRLNYTLPLGEGAVDALLARRKACIAQRDAMLAEQKACAQRGDRDGVRFFKGEAADCMKHYRAAACLLAQVAASPPGDCKWQTPWDWPPDLFDQIDFAMNLTELAA